MKELLIVIGMCAGVIYSLPTIKTVLNSKNLSAFVPQPYNFIPAGTDKTQEEIDAEDAIITAKINAVNASKAERLAKEGVYLTEQRVSKR